MEKPPYKVGDRVCRLPEARYTIQTSADSSFWTATLVEDRGINKTDNSGVWGVITDSGVEIQWTTKFFRKLTKLEQALK